MDKIPSAKDWIKYYWIDDKNRDKSNEDLLIEFTKLHVKAALKLASEKAKQIEDPYSYTGNTGSEYPADYIIDKDSILNAYPLKNIK